MSNNQTEVNINRNIKLLHFSDGVDEVIEEVKTSDLNSSLKEDNVNTATLNWGPWISHYMWKSGNKALNAIDYAGESLADFFGITTPKYQIEIDEYERLQEEKRKMEEDAIGWVPKKESGDVPLVTDEPIRDANKLAEV